MLNLVEIPANGARTEEFEIRSPTSPTGSSFRCSITAADATAPGTYTDGTWQGSWSSDTGLVTGVTPSLGDSSADIDLGGTGDYLLWINWTNTDSSPVAAFQVRSY